MKKYLFLLIGAIFLATSCTDDNLLNENDFSTNPMEKSGKAVTKTIKFQKSSGPFEVIFNDENPCFQYYGAPQMYITGGGNASHMGKFTVVNTFCFYMEGEAIIVLGDWLGFLTAANGDEIYTQVVDPLNDWYIIDGISYMEYTVIGGTGRFEGASGEVLMYGTFAFTSETEGVWELEGGGSITY